MRVVEGADPYTQKVRCKICNALSLFLVIDFTVLGYRASSYHFCRSMKYIFD